MARGAGSRVFLLLERNKWVGRGKRGYYGVWCRSMVRVLREYIKVLRIVPGKCAIFRRSRQCNFLGGKKLETFVVTLRCDRKNVEY